jgi:hydrogenase expression/formation protein HypD
MKYIDEFRSKKAVKHISQKIFEIMPNKIIRIMEVCGTHTQSFHRFGLNRLIPERLHLIAGPGCPVCVSDQGYIDRAIQLSKQENTVILTFGDMLRVPGTHSSLQKQRAEGSDVRVVYSAWDALRIAEKNPKKLIVFLAVGFETTAPTLALTLQAAKKKRLPNLFFFSALKLIPPAMKAMVSSRELKIDGFLCPGHVSTIIGSQAYEFIPKKYRITCCVAGFEPLDILEGIYLLLCQIIQNKPLVRNQYVRAVKKNGNPKAKAIINEVFKINNATWRGLGDIPQSGLQLRDKFSSFDVEKRIHIYIKHKSVNKKQRSCRCGDVLKGIIQPPECPLFGRDCTPTNPYGPCMVSSEGACNAYYRYK